MIDEIKVDRWIEYDKAEEARAAGTLTDCGFGLGGFFQDGMRYYDYIETFKDEALPYIEALRVSIIDKQIRKGGDWHQDSDCGVPVFSDNSAGFFSYRGWGDLLAAIWSEHDNKDYNYMDFYMADYTGKDGAA